MSILNSGYVGAPGGYGIKALAFSNGALHFDTPEYGTDNPDTFIHVRDSGTSVFGAGTSTSLSTSNGAAGNYCWPASRPTGTWVPSSAMTG